MTRIRFPPDALREAEGPSRAHAGAERQAAETQIAILNALPAHVALLDPDGVIVAVNESWRRAATANVLQGPDVCVGQNYLDVCGRARGDCSEEAKAAAIGIRRVLQGAASDFAIEYSCPSPTGPCWFDLRVTPVGQDRVAGAVVMHVNITERKAAEAETRELAERLTNTFESVTDGFFTLDREWRFTDVNRQAEQMFRRPRTELLGTHIWAKFPEARGTVSHRQYERAMRENVEVQFETLYAPLDTWFDVRAFPGAAPRKACMRIRTSGRTLSCRRIASVCGSSSPRSPGTHRVSISTIASCGPGARSAGCVSAVFRSVMPRTN